jgi:hypothetical protein
MEMLNVQYQIHPEAFSTEADNQVVILQYETGTYFTLNEVGMKIWKLLEQGKTLQEILDELLREYDVRQEQLRQDLLNVVNQLKERGLIL